MFPACIIKFAVISFAFLALNVHSLPIQTPQVEKRTRIYAPRQEAAFDGPKTFQTINTTASTGGTIVQTCKVTLTPIVVDGQNLVVETKECTSVFMPDGPLNTASTADTASTTDTASTVTVTSGTSTVVVTATVTDSVAESSSEASATETATAGETTATAASSGLEVIGFSSASAAASSVSSETSATDSVIATRPAAVPEVIGFISSSNAASATETAAASATGAVSATATAVASGGPQVVGFGSSSASDASATAAQATESAQAVQLPGTKLSVLPIGLGVVGGVVGVVLIVVAIVTWERKNYRFDFRKRKQQGLVGAAAPVGYGGMAQR